MTVEEEAELRVQIQILHQMVLEVSHAQNSGPWWYTRGSRGLYQQVALWVGRGQTAINRATEILDAIRLRC